MKMRVVGRAAVYGLLALFVRGRACRRFAQGTVFDERIFEDIEADDLAG